MTEASKDSSSRFFWTRFPPGKGVPRGEDLAALRRGVGKEPGSVPEMWRFYSTFRAEGGSSDPKLWAEHHALTLFSIHQQSVAQLVHETGVRVGNAVAALRRSDKFSEEAVDARFTAAATATSVDELAYHLRGLIRQIRQLKTPQSMPPKLDYTALFYDLLNWQQPDGSAKVRRHWGMQYYATPRSSEESAEAGQPLASAES